VRQQGVGLSGGPQLDVLVVATPSSFQPRPYRRALEVIPPSVDRNAAPSFSVRNSAPEPCYTGVGASMRTARLASPSLLMGLFGLFACSEQVSPHRQNSTGGSAGGSLAPPGGAGGQVLSGAGGAADAGGAGTAGTSAVCPVKQKVEAPTLSTDCQIVVRSIDPALTCGSTDCAITKALDLTCAAPSAAP
jgi:hypothetical protein